MRHLIYLLTAALCLAATPARSAMTDWTEVKGGAIRLITSGTFENGHYLAGLEFLLEPGWHTYWRAPGEAGIPPEITLKQADNLKTFEVLYPAPERYNDGFSESIVYHDGVILPIRVIPSDPDGPVNMTLSVFFGVCKDICVPGSATLELEFSRDAVEDALAKKLIARDLAAVPGPSNKNKALDIESVSLSQDKARLEITAKAAVQDGLDLFASGPFGSYIGLPKLKSRTGEKAVWTLSTNGLAVTQTDKTLRLVLTGGGEAIELLQEIDPDWLVK